MVTFAEVTRTEAELEAELRKSADIRRDLAVRYGTGLLPVLDQVARRFPWEEVWEMTLSTLEGLRQQPHSPRAYIPKVVETAAHELGYFAVRVVPTKGSPQ